MVATFCRTGAVFAICDNGAAVHQVDTGAADRLRVVQILDVLQLLRVVQILDDSRTYRVTKCCSAGGETDSAASNACGYPNAADGATPFPTIRRAVFSGFVHPCPFPCVRGCTDSTYPSIGRGFGISGFRTGATGSVGCRNFRQHRQLPRWRATSRALCSPWLALWRVLLFGGIFSLRGGACRF